MGTLKDFRDYIADRQGVVEDVERRLLALQEKYESFFQQVAAVREVELGQLSVHVAERRGTLPDGMDDALDAAVEKARRDLDAQLVRHTAEHSSLVVQAEKARAEALEYEARAHQENEDLDAEEEQLKVRNEQLYGDIESYDAQIKELSTGFGFLTRLPDLRRIQAERRRLQGEQLDVVARIESLRARWAERAPEVERVVAERETTWSELIAKASNMQARIEYLQLNRDRIVGRTALERVLFERFPERSPKEGEPAKPCPRCGMQNPEANFFCHVCATRLGADRPDFDGSLLEIAELNHHHRRFASGMQACQELVALVRGIRSGLESFSLSVESMITTQRIHPVSTLRIDVPAVAVEQGAAFDTLLEQVSTPESLHPVAFIQLVGHATDAFSQECLQNYFDAMGDELSRCARSQWG